MLLSLLLSFFLSTPAIASDSIISDDSSQKINLKKEYDYFIVNDIFITGNKITKRYIILRELDFKLNDTIKISELEEKFIKSKEHLLNTSLFNFVTIDATGLKENMANIKIDVKERWYTWPVPIFELADRNFNQWWETKDFERVNYGFFLNRDNFRGRKEHIALLARFGYSELYGFTYNIPYINKKQNSGIGFSFTYSRNHEINYSSGNNKQLFFKDEEHYVREEMSAKLNYTHREGVYDFYTIEGRYFKGKVGDTVLKLTNDYFTENKNTMEYLAFDFYFRSDHRDSKAYPLEGNFFDFDIVKIGTGILPKENIDMIYASFIMKKFQKFCDRLYFATSLRGKCSSQAKQPYYTQRGLGYGRDYIRSYEYYVVDGQNYGLIKTNLKFEIVKPKVQSVRAVPIEKFNTFHYALYANLFFDCGYVNDRVYSAKNPLSNEFLYGYGIGIDFVTYYDTVIRLEYSFNKNLENGFFLHFATPI